METLNYSELDEKIKLKFYKHIEDKFIKQYKEMGLNPFEELSKTHRDHDIEYEIDKNYVLLKTEGRILLLKKEIKSFIE